MKKITLITALIVAIAASCSLKTAKAQIALEHTYDSAFVQLYIVNLEIEGMKYVVRNYNSGVIELFNLNHSLYKTMPLPYVTLGIPMKKYILYISEHLFNDDDSIEYMFGDMNQAVWRFYILSESGNVIFYGDSLAPVVDLNAPQEQLPIYNTPNGTKMILSVATGSGYGTKARVYALGGHLSNAIQPIGTPADMDALSVFPNPSSENATIEFTLPNGINTADVVLYDPNGTEIKRYKVNRTFSNLVLNNSDLSAGTYLYQLQTANGSLGAKKMVVIK